MLDQLYMEQYYEEVKDWQDPNPKPVIVEHNGIHVVRDDLMPGGTKARGADYLIGHDPTNSHIEEWVYGSSPASGYAQVSIPYVTNRYGKKTVLFMAKRNMDNLHPFQKEGMRLGAEYHWVPNGMLGVTQKRAKDYVAESPETRKLLPLGLDHAKVIACLVKVAKSLNIQPKEVWSVGSSGTLSRALQYAWPDAVVHVVHSGGHTMSDSEIGRAIYHETRYKFSQSVADEEMPPFPTVSNYDAKAWQPMIDYHKEYGRCDPVLFWNVAGEL